MENYEAFRIAGELFIRIRLQLEFGTLSLQCGERGVIRFSFVFSGRDDEKLEVVESFDMKWLAAVDSSALPGLATRTAEQLKYRTTGKRNVNVGLDEFLW